MKFFNMKIAKVLPVALLALTTSAFASQSDPAAAAKNAVKKQSVSYTCQGGKKLTVTYGFNAQNLPTYAQAKISGKSRFMPINLNRTELVSTVFGDENNFSVMADSINFSNVRKSSINVQSPASEILFKNCMAR